MKGLSHINPWAYPAPFLRQLQVCESKIAQTCPQLACFQHIADRSITQLTPLGFVL